MSSSRDWMFCPISGYLLELNPAQGAICKVSGFKRDLSELESISVVTKTDMQDFRRRYNLEPLVKGEEDSSANAAQQRATVDETCPKCNHRGLEFYTMQLRSADEGQTVFYECTKCGHKYSQNT